MITINVCLAKKKLTMCMRLSIQFLKYIYIICQHNINFKFCMSFSKMNYFILMKTSPCKNTHLDQPFYEFSERFQRGFLTNQGC